MSIFAVFIQANFVIWLKTYGIAKKRFRKNSLMSSNCGILGNFGIQHFDNIRRSSTSNYGIVSSCAVVIS
jgi:hypothetical protein